MTISNYSQLQTAIGTWMNRADLSSLIPDFIKFAENRLNRELLSLPGETTAAITLTSGNNYATLPSGFIENISLTYDEDDFAPIQIDIKSLDDNATTSAAKPRHFAISDNIYFPMPADQTYALTMRYKKKWDIASDTTNTLLTNDPDAYLYTTMAEAALYMKHPYLERWERKAQEVINSINSVYVAVKGKSTLRTEIPQAVNGVGTTSILTDS